jgi:hypothetical protein
MTLRGAQNPRHSVPRANKYRHRKRESYGRKRNRKSRLSVRIPVPDTKSKSERRSKSCKRTKRPDTKAVEQRHQVTALVRSASRPKSYEHAIQTIEGDLLDPNPLENALRNQEAVLSAFGPRLPIAKGERDLLTRIAAGVPTMQRVNVVPLVIVSIAFLFKDAVLPPAYLFGR